VSAANAGYKNRRTKKDAIVEFTSQVASSSQTLLKVDLSHAVAAYGVGAGDSAGDGEGASTEPSVFGGFRFAALCRFGDGVGDALVTAGAVVVAVVPCCCVQEATNAILITALIKHNTYLFIGLVSVRVLQNVWLPKKFTTRE
jgi:hypothetical protein